MKKKEKSSLLSALKRRWWLIGEENTISYKFMSDFTEACCYLPKPIRKRLFYFMDNLVVILSRVILIISQTSLVVYLINGKEKHSGANLTILYLGNENPSSYILEILFSGEPQIKKSKKIHIWNYKKEINRNKSNIDAVFIKSDRFYSNFFEKQGFIVIPEWIGMFLDISEPLEDIYKRFSKGAKEDIRKIKKYGYTYEISQDIDKLKFFYYKMYLPYVSWKYKKTAECINFFALKHIFEQGSKILFIKENNEYIFGGLFLINKGKVLASYAGVMEGKFDNIQKGPIAASYFYLIQHSKECGAKEIDFGSSRSFVNDGVFKYKRKWGTRIEKAGYDTPEIFAFKVINNNKGIESFLTNNPFISSEKNRFKTNVCE
jgi:hypothetical protein